MDDKDWQLLARYYSGEASPDESLEIRRWIESDPERLRLAESVREVWDLSSSITPQHHGDARKVWQRVSTGIHKSGGQAVPRFDRMTSTSGSESGKRLLKIAAIFLVCLIPVAGATVFGLIGGGQTAVVDSKLYTTGEGERLQFVLEDGTAIDLGPNSSLEVPLAFEVDRREVLLEGLARFNVTADAERAFVVRAGDAITRVLGTQFVVRAYSNEATVRVGVVEGNVALGPSSEGDRPNTILGSGQLGLLTRNGVTSVVEDRVEFSRFVRWPTDRLEFKDHPLSDVLSELEVWYDVEIVVTDPALAAKPVSTVVEGESLQEVLGRLALVVDARYEQSGDTIVFSPQ